MMYVTVACQDRGGELDLSTIPCVDLSSSNVQDFVDGLQDLMENTIVGVTVFIERTLVKNKHLTSSEITTEEAGFATEIPIGITGTVDASVTVSGVTSEYSNPFNIKGVRGEDANPDLLLSTFLKAYGALGGNAITGVHPLRHYDLKGFAAKY